MLVVSSRLRVASNVRVVIRTLGRGGVSAVCNIMNVPIASVTHRTRTRNVHCVNFHRRRSTNCTTTTDNFLARGPKVYLAISTPKFLGNLATLTGTAMGNFPVVVVDNSDSHTVISLRRNSCRRLSRVGTTGPCTGTTFHIGRPRSLNVTLTHTVQISMSNHPNKICLSLPTGILTTAVRGSRTLAAVIGIRGPSPTLLPYPGSIADTVSLLTGTRQPLVVLNGNTTCSRTSRRLHRFVRDARVPFLPVSVTGKVLRSARPLSTTTTHSFTLTGTSIIVLINTQLG